MMSTQAIDERLLSPRQVAEAIGVSVSSLKRWCDNGQLATTKTAGGHRRIPRSEVVRFMREQGMAPNRPDLLGLPAGCRLEARESSSVLPRLIEMLTQGDQNEVSGILTGLFLAHRSMAEIADKFISPAFHQIGELWEHDKLEIYQEHRALCIAQGALRDLRALLVKPSSPGPLAISATLNDDPYVLAITLSDLVLSELGWDSRLFGTMHPAATLVKAVTTLKPRLLCLSLSYSADADAMLQACNELQEASIASGTTLVFGGTRVDSRLVVRPPQVTLCHTMGELRALVIGLSASPSRLI